MLKLPSGINNLILDKLEYSEDVSQLKTLLLLIIVAFMKAKNFEDDIPSIPIDNFKDHYVLVFHLTSMQDATENYHHREVVGEPLRLELNFTFPLEHVTDFIVLGERMSSVAADKFGVV